MIKVWLLRVHRWITLTLAIPLAILILTGLVLSFEPMVQGVGGSIHVTPETVDAALAKHDPANTARSLVVRGYAGTLSIGGARRGDAIHVDVASNERVLSPGWLPDIMVLSRRLHETLLVDLGWLVKLSTIALLALIALGIAMGWPRLRNSLAGWHKGTGWLLLPLLIVSPLTGLMLAYQVSFAGPPPAVDSQSRPESLRQAVRLVAAERNLGTVVWIRPMGNRISVRLNDGGEMRVFAVTRNGLVPAPRNWPRLVHEGNWHGSVSALINVGISVAFVGLMMTGLLIWARRRLRRRHREPATA